MGAAVAPTPRDGPQNLQDRPGADKVRAVPDVSEFVAHWGYLAIVVIVVLGNVGLAVPEESALLAGGYLVSRGDLMWSGRAHGRHCQRGGGR